MPAQAGFAGDVAAAGDDAAANPTLAALAAASLHGDGRALVHDAQPPAPVAVGQLLRPTVSLLLGASRPALVFAGPHAPVVVRLPGTADQQHRLVLPTSLAHTRCRWCHQMWYAVHTIIGIVPR